MGTSKSKILVPLFDLKSLNAILQRVSQGLQIGGTSFAFLWLMRRKRPGKNCRVGPVFALAGLTERRHIPTIPKQNQFIMPSAGRGTPLAWLTADRWLWEWLMRSGEMSFEGSRGCPASVF
jgi:hypothetical protein